MLINDPIPSFKSPPLNEVVLGVQYGAIETFNIATYGLLWEKFKGDFPNIEQHLPLEPQFEKIGGRHSLGDFQRFRIAQLSMPLPRAWFISENNQDLVQVQPDRFIRNWRRINGESNKYPRYEGYMRDEFLKNLELLDSFYQETGLGKLQPNQCEISYINHIDASCTHNNLSKTFTGWSDQYDLSNIADIEDIDLNIKHTIKNDAGEFLGRLHIKIMPAFKATDDSPIFLMELTVRGHPLGNDLRDVINFMDLGREIIVRAFTKITTSEMHNIWERER
jgi:uncharacterized protein (TIGR04255 family)